MREGLLAQGMEGVVCSQRLCKAPLSPNCWQSHPEFSDLLSLQKLGGQQRGRSGICICRLGPSHKVLAPVLVVEKLGVGRESQGLKSGGGITENTVVHAAPRAIFASVSSHALHTRDFPMPGEQNLNPFLASTIQTLPTSWSHSMLLTSSKVPI